MTLRQNLTISSIEINDPTDKVILPQSFLDAILRQYANQDLPYPLTFAIEADNHKTHVGVREFSADEGTVILPGVVLENLASKSEMSVSVSLVSLEKGTSVKLRPLTAQYDLNQDWKVALEGAFQSTYTTLSKGDMIRLRSGMRFLVDNLEPQPAVCIVDTDLEVELEPLSEEQALETVKASAAIASAQATSIAVGQVYEGSTDGHNFFVLEHWVSSKPLWILLEASDPDADLVVSVGTRRPTLGSNVWSNLNSRSTKMIEIQPSNAAIEDAKSLQIAITSRCPAQFTIQITQQKHDSIEAVITEDEVRCENCSVVVPKRSLVLHERHCKRNNIRCQHLDCDFIYKKGIEMKHWHCAQCGDPGEGSLDLHTTRFHETRTCECAMVSPNLPSLAHHRATTCPELQIVCRFCHLLVPQGDASELSYHDSSQGLSAHESACGSRTTTCETCNHLVKLKDLPTHVQIHDAQRLARPVTLTCSNLNCIHQRGKNQLGLCDECFGPLYSSQIDEDGTKIIARVKRRYAGQLMTGCKRPYCQNRYCATATLQKLSYKAAMDKIEERAGVQQGHWFCVSESVQKKRTMAEVMESEGEYAIEWCCKAIDLSGGDVGLARAWLSRTAVKNSEVART